MPRSTPWTVEIEGGKELLLKLRELREDAHGILPKAGQVGSGIIARRARAGAPGPGIIVERAKPFSEETVAFEIGPDKDHWFYRFFEFGVQPFEINMIGKRSTRSAINRKKSAARGEKVNVRGRRVQSEKRALKWGGNIIKSVVHRGAFAAKPFLRRAVRDNNDAISYAVGEVIRREIDKRLEAKGDA